MIKKVACTETNLDSNPEQTVLNKLEIKAFLNLVEFEQLYEKQASIAFDCFDCVSKEECKLQGNK